MATDNGLTGVGFSYTVGAGATAIKSMIEWDLAPILRGQAVTPLLHWSRLWGELHDVGGGGVSTAALAAVDIAMWDLVAKARGQSLVDVLGSRRPSIPAYGSGIDLHLSLPQLVDEVKTWVSQGYRGVKIKVGKPTVEEDVERIAAVRDVVGPNVWMMVDANQGWNLTEAVARCAAFHRFDLHWLEEPLISDDVMGHHDLALRTSVPIAVGENIYNKYQLQQYLRLGAVNYAQIDVVRAGGITPYLEMANLCDAWNIPMAPHFMLELSGQLLCSIPNAHILEDVNGGSLRDLGVLGSDVGVIKGQFTPPNVPGHGIAFDWNTLEDFPMGDVAPPSKRMLWT